jgi:putative iron-regulated protein
MIKQTKLIATSLILVGITLTSGCVAQKNPAPKTAQSSTLLTYADIATANYSDTLRDAKTLQNAIAAFAENPTKTTLENAKTAWLISRESYGESEIFRLSNGPIDSEDGWVGKAYGTLDPQVNAWPLDENMIDYTIDANGEKTSGNIIDSAGEFNPGGEESSAVDVTNVTADALSALNENGGMANVASGYHAIEFLLWGQDQDYSNFLKDSVTHGAMTAGQRPLSDFTRDANALRRLAYLNAASAKLATDLSVVCDAWSKDVSAACDVNATGCYRAALLGELKGADASKNIDEKEALKTIFIGMGVFLKSELANERIAVAVLTPSEEDEQSCFSDNTHRDVVANYQGFKNILTGEYKGVGYGVAPIDAMNADAKTRLSALMSKIETKIDSVNAIAKTSRHFDYQIQPNDPQAKVIIKLKNELRKLGDKMVEVALANGISL